MGVLVVSKLYFYYSAMNAGKSSLLLQLSSTYIEKGMFIILFTPLITYTKRGYSVNSRVGISSYAVPVDNVLSIYTYVIKALRYRKDNLVCVFVDEVHLLTQENVFDLIKIVDILNIPVRAFGLRSDFAGKLFGGSILLLLYGDELVEVSSICQCGRKATMTIRFSKKGNRIYKGKQIVIGGNTMYMSICRKHFFSSFF